MSYFAALLTVLALVFAASRLFKQRFETVFPIVNLSIIVFLYFFGIFDKLVLGAVLLPILAACGVGFSLFYAKRHGERAVVRAFFSPFTVIVIAFALFQYVALFFCEVVGWDELTHWALVVKNMFFSGDLGRGAETTTMFRGYPPAISLYLYFFQVFGKNFAPAHIYMAMNLLNVSLMLPVVARFHRLSSKLLAAALVLSTAFVFNVTTFISAWSDPFLAILFGYIMTVYLTSDGALTKTNAVGMLLGTFVLTAAKSTGIAFVAFAYIIILLDYFIIRDEMGKRRRVPAFLFVLAPVAAALSKLSWSFYITKNGLGEAWETSRLTLENVLAYLKEPTAVQTSVTKNFLLHLLFPLSYHGNGSATPIPYPIVFAGIVLLILLLVKRKRERKYAISLGVGVFSTFVVYAVSMLISYLFTFSEGEADNLASFVRYMNTFALGVILMLVCMLVCTRQAGEEEKKPYGKSFVSAVLFLAIVCMVACPVIGGVMKQIKAPYQAFISANAALDDGESIYIVTHANDGFLESPTEYQYILFRFYATPNDCSGLKIGGSPYIGDNFKSSYTVEELLDAYETSGYDYLYLHYIDDAFVDGYADIFAEEPRAFTFYKRAQDGLFRETRIEDGNERK